MYSGTKEDNHDGEWVPVIPVPGALTINTGDMMQVDTKRVVFVVLSAYAAVFFKKKNCIKC